MSITGGKTHHAQPSGEADFSLQTPAPSWQDANGSLRDLQPDSCLPVLKIHPAIKELSEILPALPAKEREQLKESIKANGIQVPVIVNRSMDTLIDGVHRWRIAHELGLKVQDVPLQVFEGEDEEVTGLVLRLHAFRRHLKDDQRLAAIALLRAPQLEKEARERKEATQMAGRKAGTFAKKGVGEPEIGFTDKGSLVEHIAEEAGVSKHKAEQALKARKAGTLKQVAKGKMKLREAAAQSPKPDKGKKAKGKGKLSFEDQVWKRWETWLKHYPIGPQQEKVLAWVHEWTKPKGRAA